MGNFLQRGTKFILSHRMGEGRGEGPSHFCMVAAEVCRDRSLIGFTGEDENKDKDEDGREEDWDEFGQ